MKKLQEAIYLNQVDLNDLFCSRDKRGFGFVSLSDFEKVLRLAPITLTQNELEEIKSSILKDSNNNINYKELQLSLSRPPSQKPSTSSDSFINEKIACALNEFLMQVPSNLLTFDDFRKIMRKTWLTIPLQDLRKVWEVLPHDKFILASWAKKHSVPVETFEITQVESETKETLPKILSLLKEIAIFYGNSFLLAALKVKDWVTQEEFRKLLQKFRVSFHQQDFDEFRIWAVEKGLMKDLKVNTGILSLYFVGVDFVEKQNFSSDRPVVDQVLQRTFFEIIREKLMNLKKCLQPFIQNDYVEEIRLREVLKVLVPSLTNENVSLFLNSLRFSLQPSFSSPFRQINVPEFLNLFDPNQEISIPPNEKPLKNDLPRTFESFSTVQETFKVHPRDYLWEKQIISQVFAVSQPLLCNFRIYDWNHSGALTLETFHFVLVKSLNWLDNEKINFLVDLALRECGSIDDSRTLMMRGKDFEEFRESISKAWFPDGEQFNISYVYFLVVLERLKL
jgi:hypothetical protein